VSARSALALAALAAALTGCGGGGDPPAASEPAARRAPHPAREQPCQTLRPRVSGRVADPALDELSGLVSSRTRPGVLWAHEDSGAAPELIALRAGGRVLGRFAVPGASALDWEAIATGPAPGGGALLYVGDIGDNEAGRDSVDVYRLPEPDPARPGVTAPAQRLRLRYPDGAHDAEALLVDPLRDELMVVTKELGGTRAYVTRASGAAGRVVTLRRGPALPLLLVTAGDVSADGGVVALRTYTELLLWPREGRRRVTAALRGTPCRSPVARGEGQGETLALDRRGRTALTVPEGGRPALRLYAPAPR